MRYSAQNICHRISYNWICATRHKELDMLYELSVFLHESTGNLTAKVLNVINNGILPHVPHVTDTNTTEPLECDTYEVTDTAPKISICQWYLLLI